MSYSSFDQLPEELQLHVFEYLDEAPPSQSKARLEPSLQLTCSGVRMFKDVSRVSRRWRRIILPLLFRHARLNLQTSTHRTVESDKDQETARTQPNAKSAQWAGQMQRHVKNFLQFVQDHEMATSVRSIVLSMDSQGQKPTRFPHSNAIDCDHRYRASAVMWRRLLSVIHPSRVVIVAPPVELAALTNCAIDTVGGWAFTDMEFHILELGIEGDARRVRALDRDVNTEDVRYIPPAYPGIAASSILKMRPWTHLGLNEGSFLKAYGTYEFFERGPPSLTYSIKDCIEKAHWETLCSFTYTAIFPFAGHLDLRALLPQLEELDVQLAPDPSSGILHDQARIGRAELQDCWQEMFTAYRFITRSFNTFAPGLDRVPKLKKFVCRDMRTPLVQEELDEEFTPLCLPVWGEFSPGVFTRLAEKPYYDAQFDEVT